MTRYQVLEVSDSRDFCECCGKTGLKRVVFIRDSETDTVKHFGTTCATAPAKGFNLDREVKEAVARFSSYEACLAAAARIEYRKAGGEYISIGDGRFVPASEAMYAGARIAAIARGFNF